jgi:hypothetical protein
MAKKTINALACALIASLAFAQNEHDDYWAKGN